MLTLATVSCNASPLFPFSFICIVDLWKLVVGWLTLRATCILVFPPPNKSKEFFLPQRWSHLIEQFSLGPPMTSTAPAKRDFNDMFLVLQQHGIEHLANVLAENDYHLHNLDLITVDDLSKLRITNRDAREALLGLGSWVRFRKEVLASHTHTGDPINSNDPLPTSHAADNEGGVSPPMVVAEEDEIAAGGGLYHLPEGATANEYCRQATTFLQHYRVDRQWPKPRSQLAQHLSLPTSRAPKMPSQPFRIKGRPARYFAKAGSVGQATLVSSDQSQHTWREVGQRNPIKELLDPFPTKESPLRARLANQSPTRRASAAAAGEGQTVEGAYEMAFEEVHEHGKQARSCPVCKRHARERYGDGHWQYRALVKVRTQTTTTTEVLEESTMGVPKQKSRRESKRRSKGGYDLVPMWIPFSDGDALILETAFRKGTPDALVCGKLAHLKKMRWGGRPLRRSHCGSVPFTGVPVRDTQSGRTFINTAGDVLDGGDNHEDVIRQEIADAEIAARIRETFAELLDVEEVRSRSNVLAEEDASYHVVLNRFTVNLVRLLAKALCDCEYEEARERAVISREADGFHELLANQLEEAWCGEHVRVQALAENLAADRLLRVQRDVVEEREATERNVIEEQQAAAWDLLGKGIRALNKQVRLFVHKAFQEALPTHDSTRCPKCFDATCPFYRKPWRNHWQHVGGPLDLKPPDFGLRSLDALIANTTEIQLEDLGAHNATSDANKVRASARFENTNHTSSAAAFSAGLRPASVGAMKHTSKQPYGVWRLDAEIQDEEDDPTAHLPHPHAISHQPKSPVPLEEPPHQSSNAIKPVAPRPFTALQNGPVRPQAAHPGRPSSARPVRSEATSQTPHPPPVTLSARQRRALEDARKPQPFRHSVGGLKDVNGFTPRSIRDGFTAPVASPRSRRVTTEGAATATTPPTTCSTGSGDAAHLRPSAEVATGTANEAHHHAGACNDLSQPPMHFGVSDIPTSPRRLVSVQSHEYKTMKRVTSPRTY